MDKIITVEILGQEYQFKADPRREDAEDIVNFLKTKVEEIQEKVKNISDHKIIILAALGIVSEYYQLRREFETYRGLMAEKSKKLIDTIDMQFS